MSTSPYCKGCQAKKGDQQVKRSKRWAVSFANNVTVSDTDSYETYSMPICNTQAVLRPAGKSGSS